MTTASKLRVLAGAILIASAAACQSANTAPEPEANEEGCSQTYAGGAATALANSDLGCDVTNETNPGN